MNNGHQDEVGNGGAPTSLSEPLAQDRHQTPWRTIHQRLQGRYHWAILLGMTASIAAAYLCYRGVTLMYQATGTVHVNPIVPQVLYKSEESGVMPMFEGFVASQEQMLQSPRVRQMAMEDARWKSVGRGFTPEQEDDFSRNLKVQRSPAVQVISVTYADADNKVAEAAVKCVIDAYKRLYQEADKSSDARRRETLQELRQTLEDKYQELRRSILALAQEYGTDSLDRMYDAKVQQVSKFQDELHQAEQQVSAAEFMVARMPPGTGAGAGAGAATQPATQPADTPMTASAIGLVDETMRSLLLRRTDLEMRIREAREQGVKENHPHVADRRKSLEAVNKQIDEYTERFNREFNHERPLQLRMTQTPVPAAPTSQPALELQLARQQFDRAKALYEDARKEELDLGKKALAIKNLREEADLVQQRLTEAKFRIEQLAVESTVSGRIDADSENVYLNPIPVNLAKRRQMMILGGMAGMFLGVGAIFLVGVFDRRIRRSDDQSLGIGRPNLLGMLPVLPKDLSDPDQATIAAYSVHQIRTLLQLTGHGEQPRVLTVTGPSSGCGKTSLTLALGLSFAGAGSRTLLIDADLAGGGLSRRLEINIARRIGRVLRNQGAASDAEVHEALRLAKVAGRRLGETLVEMKVISEEALAGALAHQSKSNVGLLDALKGEPCQDCVAPTGVDNLWVLPVGRASAVDMSRISPAAVERLLGQVRENYDVVLIDAGPVPGSVDSSIFAAHADESVMVITRGDHRQQVQTSLRYLSSIGAHLGGVVFNRADTSDMLRSTHSQSPSLSRISRPQGAEVLPAVHAGHPSRLGPLADAVAAFAESAPQESAPGLEPSGNGNGQSH